MERCLRHRLPVPCRVRPRRLPSGLFWFWPRTRICSHQTDFNQALPPHLAWVLPLTGDTPFPFLPDLVHTLTALPPLGKTVPPCCPQGGLGSVIPTDWLTWVSTLRPASCRLTPVRVPAHGKQAGTVPCGHARAWRAQGLPACVHTTALPSASLTWRPGHTQESGWPRHERAELSLRAGRPPRVPRVVTGCLPSWAPAHLERCPQALPSLSQAIGSPGPPPWWPRSRPNAPTRNMWSQRSSLPGGRFSLGLSCGTDSGPSGLSPKPGAQCLPTKAHPASHIADSSSEIHVHASSSDDRGGFLHARVAHAPGCVSLPVLPGSKSQLHPPSPKPLTRLLAAPPPPSWC